MNNPNSGSYGRPKRLNLWTSRNLSFRREKRWTSSCTIRWHFNLHVVVATGSCAFIELKIHLKGKLIKVLSSSKIILYVRFDEHVEELVSMFVKTCPVGTCTNRSSAAMCVDILEDCGSCCVFVTKIQMIGGPVPCQVWFPYPNYLCP